MSDPYGLDRRELLRQMSLLVGGIATSAFVAGCRRDPEGGAPIDAAETTGDGAAAAGSAGAPAHALLPPQRATLEAACARILPSDQDPGAREADVIEYIDRELARPEFEVLKTNVLAGIVALDRHATRNAKKQFVQLAPAEQDEVLHMVQNASERGADFLKFLILLTIEGFLGDPMYGGNKGGVGWKLIGYGTRAIDGSGMGHGHH